MPSFTISGSNDFKKSVQKTAKKLGLSYGAYLRKAHRACLETLTSKDFEKAKKLIELQESKERLSSLREKETILLREKAYKNKNLRRIFHDIEDPEIRREVERIAELREEEADNQIRLYEEINPSYEPKKKKMFSKEKKKHDPLRLKEEKLVEKLDAEHNRQQEKLEEIREKERRRKEQFSIRRKLLKNPRFGLDKGQVEYIENVANEEKIPFLKAKENLFGDCLWIPKKMPSNSLFSLPSPSKKRRNEIKRRKRR